ncbi:MAG: PQQ-dependent sugar dehydrogenase [Phycisphaerales bacterium]
MTAGAISADRAARAQELRANLVVEGLESPVFVTSDPDDAKRLFIVERRGAVRVFHDGRLRSKPFLTIRGSTNLLGDGGLFCIAFHPNFTDNGYVYIAASTLNNDYLIARYTVAADDPHTVDPDSGTPIMFVNRPEGATQHYGGTICFGPDGMLYISSGDAGPQGDPNGHGQNGGLLYGKILRIDVDGAFPYAIPVDNPFVGDPTVRDEIWMLGMRNPWRMSFDRQTGELYIADVGQDEWEEIDVIPPGMGGLNGGWNRMEGVECYHPPFDCDPNGELFSPAYTYEHTLSPRFRCAITGGHVYRGSSLPLWNGAYFFGDWCSNEIWSIRVENGVGVDLVDHTPALSPPAGADLPATSSFGEDADGELYVLDYRNGGVYRIASRLHLDVAPLIAGESASMGVTNATPGAMVYFVYSVRGVGPTPAPQLGTTLALLQPTLIGQSRANGTGLAGYTAQPPANAQGRRVWLQAAHQGASSNVVDQLVQ